MHAPAPAGQTHGNRAESAAATGSATPPLPPGPPLPPFVQTLLLATVRPAFGRWLHRRYGAMVRLRVMPRKNMVQVSELGLIREVFAGQASVFHAGEGNVVLKPVMGEHSVLITDEDTHLRARKLLMPAFHGHALRGYRELITELAEQEVRGWRPGRTFSSHDRMQVLTLEIILRVVFGVASGPRLDELRSLLRRVVDIGPIDILGWHSTRLKRYGPWRRNALTQARVDELIHAEITERRQAADLDSREDVLSRLLLAESGDGDRLSDAELRDQLITLLLAGHETTATALAWSLHELSRDRARLATATAAADAGDDEYLDAVVKEAMRLRPVIPNVARRLTTEVELGGYRIPAGFTLAPAIAEIQADPEHHDHPGEFRPERFLGAGPTAGTWIPFGGGVRRCLGAGFAMMEATIVLRAVLTHHVPSADRARPETAKPRNITLIPARGARISVRHR